jgi:ABC-2 type transport system ATP-binding protein
MYSATIWRKFGISRTPPDMSMTSAGKEFMIEVNGLSKCYGPLAAIENVSFRIPRGQVAALLGPDCAGKSTTMKILAGSLSATHGTAKISGFDVHTDRLEAAKMIGYLPENSPLYLEMTPAGMLRYLGEARGLDPITLSKRLEYVAEKCALKEVWGKAIGKLSRGFRQCVGLAQALLHDPQILILDEPMTGLDPKQVNEIRELICGLASIKTILLSTRSMEEVRAVASRMIFIFHGQVVGSFDLDGNEMAT